MLKVKPFLFILFLTVFVALFTTACSDSGSSSGNGGGIYDNSTNPDNPGGDTDAPDEEVDKPGVTAIDLAGNPFSLLGVYDVTLYGIDGEPVTTPASKSELRVGLNLATAAGGMTAPEVLMYLDFEGKQITFDKYIIDLSGLATAGGDLNKFIADTFANLGAELIENSKYGLYFTLDPAKNPNYSPIIDNLIIKNGQYLKLKLDKTKNLVQDGGLGLDGETPTDPEEPEEPVTVPVERVTISGQPASVVHGGAPFKLTASVLPNNATNKVVTWSSSHPDYISVDNQGNVTIKGYVEETITITAASTADKTKTDSYEFNIEKAAVTGISVIPAEMTLTLRKDGSTVSANITTAIEPAIATDYTSVKYEVTSGQDYITVDSKGVVTAVKEGNATVTVTAAGLTKTVTVTVNPAPTVEIPVTNITVTTSADKVYKKGTNVAVNFTLTPANTTDNMVSYSMQSGSGHISTANGSGILEVTNVQGGETITFTTVRGQKATYTINAVDVITSVSFKNETITVEQTKTGSNELNIKEAIQNSSSSITYESLTPNLASVNSSTGVVTGLKNGIAKIRVTVIPKYDSNERITAEYEVDVLGLVDFSSNDSFIASAQGTYNITFFGTNPGKASGFMGGQTEVPVTTDCELYKELFMSTKCEGGGFVKNIIVNKDKFVGKATITIQDDGSAVIHTKILMTAESMAKNSPNDQYQYSVYRTTSGGDSDNSKNTVQGITGRHLTAKGTWATSTFNVRQYKNNLSKEIILYSNLIGKEINIPIVGDKTVNPITYVIMSKESSQPEKMGYSDISVAPFNKVTGINPTDFGEDAPHY